MHRKPQPGLIRNMLIETLGGVVFFGSFVGAGLILYGFN